MVLILFAIGALSDLADGYVARRLNTVSALGAFIDPLADRLLIISVLAIVWSQNMASGWLCGALIIRDLLAMIGYQFLKRKTGYQPQVSWFGKTSSAAAMIAIIGIFILPLAWANAVLLIAVLLAYGSLFDYLIREIVGRRVDR